MDVTAEDGLALRGTLTSPAGPGPHPAVLLLCPGRTDRDGNVGKAKIELGPPLTKALADKGIATYRFDRRGAGATGGKVTAFAQHRRDAAAALDALAARPDIADVAVIGYSEGALHGAWLAAHGAKAVVLIAGHASTGEQAMLHYAEHLRPDEIPAPIRVVLRLLGRTPREQMARILAKIRKGRIYGFRAPAWLREYLTYDPKPDLAAIEVPVLAVIGDKDRQIDPAELTAIARLVPHARTHLVPDLTHMLRRDPGPATLKNYPRQFQRPVDQELITELTDWVSAQLAPARP